MSDNLCPICGEKITITGKTKDGRLIGSCGDAFSEQRFYSCDSCQALMINGVYCHEQGCPNAWKNKRVECRECGDRFYPQERYQQTCDSCLFASQFEYLPEEQ